MSPIERIERFHHGERLRRGGQRLWMLVLLFAMGCGAAADDSGGPPSNSDDTQTEGAAASSTANNPTASDTGEDGVDEAAALDHPFPRRMAAPPIDGGVSWLNTAEPLAIDDLRGKFVLLDFWTYCCINCLHVLPELKKLEQAYPNELVVIGVHSAKFATERLSENIREAVMRHEIEHPVVNDADHKIWRRFGVRSWPTLVLIDPEGQAIWGRGGESKFEDLDAVLRRALPYYRAKGVLDATPRKFALEADGEPATPLRFPGKVLADESSDRLFIADSNHNRIVVATLDGKLIDTIGSGQIGRADGDFGGCSFDHPQGMVLDGETLYVADTENHLIRKVDLPAKAVTTIAGTGKQAHNNWPGWNREQNLFGQPTNLPDRFVGPALTTALNSPWALWLRGDDLYIANAGSHQLWRMSLEKAEVGPYAGNGREDIVDGPLLPKVPYAQGFASFAQPSGLASDGEWLFVADCEGSSIRAVPFDASSESKTIIGSSALPGARLFIFGDRDGEGLAKLSVPLSLFRGDAEQTTGPLLQHALGVAYYDGKLYVADTYNNKIKVVDVDKQSVKTLAGTGQPGSGDAPAQFDEPAGVTAGAGKLFVADTNNHAIRVVKLGDPVVVTTLEIGGLAPPVPAAGHTE